MVSLKITYETDLDVHCSEIRANETLYISKDGAFKDEISIPCKVGESFALNINNFLLIENESITKNPFKIIASLIVTFFIVANSDSMYDDFDCWDYETEFILKPINTTPSVMIKVLEHEDRGKSTFIIKVNECEMVPQKTKAEINKDYINLRFEKYFRFHFLATIFFSAIFITLLLLA